MIVRMQVLVDADNLDVPRLRLLLAALQAASWADVVVAGAPAVLDALDWPAHTQLLPVSSNASRSHNLTAPHIIPTDPALDGGAQLRAWLAREQRCES